MPNVRLNTPPADAEEPIKQYPPNAQASCEASRYPCMMCRDDKEERENMKTLFTAAVSSLYIACRVYM
jgi:hypothetical protein